MSETLALYTSTNFEDLSDGREVFEFLGGDLVPDSLRELVTMSLFTWRRALDSDPLPPGASREGWFADPTFGSRLYLLARAKVSTTTLADAKRYAEEALAWMVDDGILAGVEATVTRRANGRGIEMDIALSPPSGEASRIRYAYLTEA